MKQNQMFLAVALLLVVALVIWMVRRPDAGSLGHAQTLERIRVLVEERNATVEVLSQQKYQEGARLPADAYLTKIRKDGLPAHADMKQKLLAIEANNTALLTLVDLYEPYAKTPQFKAEVRHLREYALTWNDRWNSVMDYFMAGGNYPSSEVPFRPGFAEALQAEAAAVGR